VPWSGVARTALHLAAGSRHGPGRTAEILPTDQDAVRRASHYDDDVSARLAWLSNEKMPSTRRRPRDGLLASFP
jgi:hypothetical protein